MSVKATNFVRSLRGLTQSEKLVAFVLADHDSHKGSGAYPSMQTVAHESGLKDRETASRITSRLVSASLLLTDSRSKGGRGKTTIYRFNYSLENCDSRITVCTLKNVTPQSQLQQLTVTEQAINCDCGDAVSPETVTQKPETVTLQSHEGVEGFKRREKKGKAPALSSERIEELAEYVVEVASEGDSRANFRSKDIEAVKKAIAKMKPNEAQLKAIVTETVRHLDDFDIKHAGDLIAAALPGKIRVQHKRQVQREKEETFARQVEAENERERVTKVQAVQAQSGWKEDRDAI
jgi:hypothetical protein